MSRTEVDFLEGAKARISDPANWCQGTMVRDANGKALNWFRQDLDGPACQWCAKGAMEAEYQAPGDAWDASARWKAFTALEVVAWCDGWASFVALNDGADHAAVMEMFDAAIQIAKEELAEEEMK